MALFHYSLNLTGCLLLGTSESVKTASTLFATVDEICKIYVRKLSLSRPLFAFTTPALPVTNISSSSRLPETFSISFDLAREVDQLISNRYAPVSVVVDERLNILQMLQPRLEAVLTEGQPLQDFELTHEFERIGLRTVLLNACKLRSEDDLSMILLSIEDVTDRKQFEAARSQLLAQEQAARQQAEAADLAAPRMNFSRICPMNYEIP